MPVDFDVSDGLEKMAQLGIVACDDAGSRDPDRDRGSGPQPVWSGQLPQDAVQTLRNRWQQLGTELVRGESPDAR